jgi:hypothetical protein
MEAGHTPVLAEEIMSMLAPARGSLQIDATLGGGGHTERILEATDPDGRLLGLDADGAAIARVDRRLRPRFGDRLVLRQANFRQLATIAREAGFDKVEGALFDLGLSSDQLADTNRGFGFRAGGPLDMRFDTRRGVPASELLASLDVNELTALFRRYGEEPKAGRVARAIVDARRTAPVATAEELALAYDESFLLARLTRLQTQLGNQAAAAQRQEQLSERLERVKLPRECQLGGWLAAALKAHYAGETKLALLYAELASQLSEQGEILFRLVDTDLILGHTRAAAAQWESAAAAFRQALEAFTKLDKPTLAAEPRAGLAQIALAQGDLGGAQAQVEAILPVLAEHPRAGYNNPFFTYLTGYRVLAANRDPRAATLLQRGYALLQQDAAVTGEAEPASPTRVRNASGRNRGLGMTPAFQEAQAIEILVRRAIKREDLKAQHGPVRVIMKDGVLLENK